MMDCDELTKEDFLHRDTNRIRLVSQIKEEKERKSLLMFWNNISRALWTMNTYLSEISLDINIYYPTLFKMYTYREAPPKELVTWLLHSVDWDKEGGDVFRDSIWYGDEDDSEYIRNVEKMEKLRFFCYKQGQNL